MQEATFEDAVKLAQKLNLNKQLVWKIIEGKKFSSPTELAMLVQQAFAVPDHTQK